MRIRMPHMLEILLPLCLLAFFGSYISFLHIIINENTRWIYFLLLLMYLILKRGIFRHWGQSLSFVFVLYFSWCFLSSFWSDVPLLSFLKTCTLGLVVLTLVSAGIEWIKTHTVESSLNYISFSLCVFLFTDFIGMQVKGANYTNIGTGGLNIYQGLVTGSNMSGFMMAVIFPLLLWKTYNTWGNKRFRYILLTLLVSCVYFLLIAMSRSAILLVLITSMGFLISLKLAKKTLILILGAQLIFFTCIVYPPIVTKAEEIAKVYIYKSNVGQTSVFKNRNLVWDNSYDAAIEGGWFGLGYGVTWGQSEFSLDNGLTSSHYGREKGNSQLAIIEETGLVGIGLYALLLITILFKLIRMHLISPNGQHRILIGIITGVFLGMIVESIFEAWWDAPGGPESGYFWILIGIIRGLEIVTLRYRRDYAPSRIETPIRENLVSPA